MAAVTSCPSCGAEVCRRHPHYSGPWIHHRAGCAAVRLPFPAPRRTAPPRDPWFREDRAAAQAAQTARALEVVRAHFAAWALGGPRLGRHDFNYKYFPGLGPSACAGLFATARAWAGVRWPA